MVKGVRFVTNLPRYSSFHLLVWVSLVVYILQLADSVVSIELCALQRTMSLQLLFLTHIGPSAEQMCGKGVAQNVW